MSKKKSSVKIIPNPHVKRAPDGRPLTSPVLRVKNNKGVHYHTLHNHTQNTHAPHTPIHTNVAGHHVIGHHVEGHSPPKKPIVPKKVAPVSPSTGHAVAPAKPNKPLTPAKPAPVKPASKPVAKPSSSVPASPRLKGPSSYRSTGGQHPGYGGTQFSVSEAQNAFPHYQSNNAPIQHKELFTEMGKEIAKRNNAASQEGISQGPINNPVDGIVHAWNNIVAWFGA